MSERKEGSAAMLCSGLPGWIGIPRVVRRMFRAHVATVSRSGHTVSVDCAGLDEADELHAWLEYLPRAIELADESIARRKASQRDIDRLTALPLLEQLRDRGDAMKIVPGFALALLSAAADAIEERDKTLHRIAMESFAENG